MRFGMRDRRRIRLESVQRGETRGHFERFMTALERTGWAVGVLCAGSAVWTWQSALGSWWTGALALGGAAVGVRICGLLGLAAFIVMRPLYLLLAACWLLHPALGWLTAMAAGVGIASPLLLLRPAPLGVAAASVLAGTLCMHLPRCGRLAVPRLVAILGTWGRRPE